MALTVVVAGQLLRQTFRTIVVLYEHISNLWLHIVNTELLKIDKTVPVKSHVTRRSIMSVLNSNLS